MQHHRATYQDFSKSAGQHFGFTRLAFRSRIPDSGKAGYVASLWPAEVLTG
jgi:hypothetical protein